MDEKAAFETSLHFEGEPDRGCNLVLNMQIAFEEEGVNLFHVTIDGEPLTVVPFRVIYARTTTSVGPR